MQKTRNHPQEPWEETEMSSKKPGTKRRIWKRCVTAAGTVAAVLLIWKLPASLAEKSLKDIDWR